MLDMKNLFYSLFAFAILALAMGCNKDDDGGNNGGGTGGGMDDLEISMNWETVGVDLDLGVIDPTGGIAGSGVAVNSNATSTPDDLEGPGTETITFDNNAPDGNYVVTVTIIDSDVSSPFTLTIRSAGDSRTFNETIIDTPSNDNDGSFILTFQKNGRNLIF